jgi:hypothetical protein
MQLQLLEGLNYHIEASGAWSLDEGGSLRQLSPRGDGDI